MGLFDLPGPLLSAADSLLSFLSPQLRLLAWAFLTGALSMLCYWLFSAQGKVGAAKTAALDARRALNSYAGHEFSELWPLVSRSLKHSLTHFWVVLGPALLGSLPALAIIVWVSNQFGYLAPPAGSPLTLEAEPAIELALMRDDNENNNDLIYIVSYPSSGSTTDVYAAESRQQPLLSLPLATPVPVVHKRVWWNRLIGNPAGYLPPNAPTEAVRFDLEPQRFLSFGPDWLQTWEAPYFLMLILSSLGIKFAFRID